VYFKRMNITPLPPLALDSLSGPRHLLLGFRLLLQPGVRGLMLVPLIGNVIVYSAAAGLAFWGVDAALDRWLPASWDWLRWLAFPLVALLLLVVAFFTFTLLANLILAPFNGLLSERVERALTGSSRAVSPPLNAATIKRVLRQESRRLLYIGLRVAAVFLLGLIPVVGLIAVPLGIVLGAWLLALEFAGNPLGNWGLAFAEQRDFLRAHRAGMFGFGLAAMGLALVPVINFALIPAAVAGMTAYCLRLRPA
jgi:CysZ protein